MHPAWNEIADAMLPHGGLIMLVHAYFDESIGNYRAHDVRDGSQRNLESLCVAGYLVESEQAKLLSQEWQAVLNEFGLPYFHMVDCAHGNGVFKALTKPQRIHVAARMIGNIKRRTLRGIGISLNVSQFRALMTPEHPFITTPYTLCAHALLGAVQRWMQENKYTGKVAYFFEAGHCSAQEASRLMEIMFLTPALGHGAQYAGHSFVQKADSAGVQAADLLAWQMHTETRRQIERSGRPPRKDFESLFLHPHNAVFVEPRHYVAMAKAWGLDPALIEASVKASDEYYASLRNAASAEQSS